MNVYPRNIYPFTGDTPHWVLHGMHELMRRHQQAIGASTIPKDSIQTMLTTPVLGAKPFVVYAAKDQVVIGMAFIERHRRNENSGYPSYRIRWLVVRPSYRNKKEDKWGTNIVRALLMRIEDDRTLADYRYHSVFIEVHPKREYFVQAFYERTFRATELSSMEPSTWPQQNRLLVVPRERVRCVLGLAAEKPRPLEMQRTQLVCVSK